MIRAGDLTTALREFSVAGWRRVEGRELCSPQGVALRLLIAGERAGMHTEVTLPDPGSKNITVIENLPVLTLTRLIETKLTSGQGNLRRTHRDFADVVELIAVRTLNSSFARRLHKSL